MNNADSCVAGNAYEEIITNVCDCLQSNNCIITHERYNHIQKLRKLYGPQSFGTDHMIETKDYVIYIEDKWRISKPSQSDMRNFVCSVQHIESMRKSGDKHIYLIYMSQQNLTKGAQDVLNATKYNHKCINSENCIDNIFNLVLYLNNILNHYNQCSNEFLLNVSCAFNKRIDIMDKLYSLRIFLYENDGSAIMLNN